MYHYPNLVIFLRKFLILAQLLYIFFSPNSNNVFFPSLPEIYLKYNEESAVWEQRLVVSATQETEAEHGSNLEVWSGEQDHINK